MTMPVWPASLPLAPRYGGYRETPRANVVSFTPDVGAPLTRRRGTVRTARVQVGFQLTGEQVAIFERFFEEELFDGSLPFRWLHPRKQEDRRWQFDMQQGGDPYTVQPASDRAHNLWDVSFSLVMLSE